MIRVRKTAVRFAIVLIASITSVALAQEARGGGAKHEYFYFDQVRPLTLDVQRIAMVTATGDEALRQKALQRAGLDAAALTPWSSNWQLASLPPQHRSPVRIEQLMSDLAAMEGAFVSPVFVDDLGGPLIVTPDILVRFRGDVAPQMAEEILMQAGSDEIRTRDWAGLSGAYRVRMKSGNGFEVLAAANALALRHDVIFAEPDFLFTGMGGAGGGPALPNDALFAQQWALHNVGQGVAGPCNAPASGMSDFDLDGPEAWEFLNGKPAVILAVLDTGIELNHADLQMDAGLSADVTSQAGNGGPIGPCDNHGTLVAGTAGAIRNNGIGVAGLVPGCRLASVRTFIGNAAPCTGGWTSQSSWTVDALQWAQKIGARVTNNSNGYGFTSAAIESKYVQTRAMGMVHFACTGNDGAGQIASLCSVNAVGMVNRFGLIVNTSNFGDGTAFVAPGGMIVTTDRTGAAGANAGDYHCGIGTSFASPYAAGVAAMVLAEHPQLDAYEVEVRLQRTTRDLGASGYDTVHGWGMVNAFDALALPPFRLADITADNVVNVNDLLSVISNWGPCPGICPAPCAADCTGDRLVNVNDLLAVIGNWG